MYRLFYRYFPRLLYITTPRSKSNYWYNNKRDYCERISLTNEDYNSLRKYLRHLNKPTGYSKLNGVFSPLGLTIEMGIYDIIKKMGIPYYITKNRHIMKGYSTLFYKKQIGRLKCVFQLHLHKNKLFLFQVSINKNNSKKEDKTNLIELLLGDYIETCDYSFYDKKYNCFKDHNGHYLHTINELFETQFTLLAPEDSSFNQFLMAKQKFSWTERRNVAHSYSHIFVKDMTDFTKKSLKPVS